MASKFVSRENVIVILGALTIVCLALTIVTFADGLTADAFASVFSVAFFAAFALAMAEQRSRNPGPS